VSAAAVSHHPVLCLTQTAAAIREMAWRKKQKAGGGGDSPKPPTPKPAPGPPKPKPGTPKPAADGGDEPPAGMSKMQ